MLRNLSYPTPRFPEQLAWYLCTDYHIILSREMGKPQNDRPSYGKVITVQMLSKKIYLSFLIFRFILSLDTFLIACYASSVRTFIRLFVCLYTFHILPLCQFQSNRHKALLGKGNLSLFKRRAMPFLKRERNSLR